MEAKQPRNSPYCFLTWCYFTICGNYPDARVITELSAEEGKWNLPMN